MGLPKFLWFLVKKDGRSGSVVNKVVTYSGTPKPLPQTPIGWMELLIAYERSIEDHGLVGTYTLPIGLVRDAAQIAREAVYKETIEVELMVLIQRLTLLLTPTTYEWFYKYFYRAELDFSQFEDGLDVFSVPALQSGLMRLLKSNRKTYFKFSMNDPRVVFVLMDGMEIENTIAGIVENGLSNDGGYFFKNHLLELNLVTAEVGFLGTGKSVSRIRVGNTNSAIRATEGYFMKSTVTNNVEVDFDFDFTMEYTPAAPGLNPAAVFKIVVRRIDESNISTLQEELFSRNAAQGFNGSFTAQGSFIIPVVPGDELYLYAFCNIQGVSGDDQIRIVYNIDSETIFRVKFRYKHGQSYVRAFKRSDMYKMLIEKNTGDINNAISQLCIDNNNRVITCEGAIRGLDDAELTTSLDDFIKDCDATFMAGLSVLTNGIELEEREKYYDESDEIDLGIVKDFKKRPATDYMYNTYKFGHPKQTIEEVNGKYGFNGNNQFTGPVTKVIKEYNMVSPYKADPWEIETMRINFDKKNTTDSANSGQVYVLATDGTDTLIAEVSFWTLFNGIVISDAGGFRIGQQVRITGSVSNDGVYDVAGFGSLLIAQIVSFTQPIVDEGLVTVTIEWLSGAVHTLERPTFSTLDITPDFTTATVFNVAYFTPKRMLLRHKRWLRSANAGLDSKKIAFASGGKENLNTKLKTIEAGVTIDEDLDETISSFGDYIFLPWEFIFKTQVPIDLPELIEDNPNRSFKITDEFGKVWRGFSLMAAIAANDYTPQEYKLLAAPSNDIKLLIHG